MEKYASLAELLKATIGMSVSDFSKLSGRPERTLRDWFKNEDLHAALLLMIDGVKYRNGWSK